MKKVRLLFAAMLCIAYSLNSCDFFDPVSGKLVSHSDCKSSKGEAVSEDTPDSLSCVSYSYDASAKVLSLEHINAGFNCCPERLSCHVSLNGSTLTVTERELLSLCDCNCLFDLNIEVEGLNAQEYHIVFDEPYCGDQEALVFDVDLLNNPEGSFCVVRKQYPWGMISGQY